MKGRQRKVIFIEEECQVLVLEETVSSPNFLQGQNESVRHSMSSPERDCLIDISFSSNKGTKLIILHNLK
jgi:hypothetical protein